MYESIIAEYLEFVIPPFIPREGFTFELPKPARNNIIYTITGVRRCGKTFYMYQLMETLAQSGVSRNRMLHLSFDDERLMPFTDHILEELFTEYLQMVPSATEGCYLFFDEIQEVPYWTNFIRRISEQHNVTIVLTGSSSKLLSSDIPTNFRGRSLSREMWPLSFAEFCQFNAIHPSEDSPFLTAQQRKTLEKAFESYLEIGGFPAVQKLPVLDRVGLLQAYASEIVTKDVLERFGTTSYRVADRFARNALRSTGLKFSVNKQVKTLRSLGIPVADEKLYALMDDLEDAHLLFKVSDYTLSVKDNPKSSYKVYSVDPGLSLAVAPASHMDQGQRLETAVFLELKRRYGANRMNTISSYSAVDCPEVDFVVGDNLTELQYELIQVAVEVPLQDPFANEATQAKYRSEIGNLKKAMELTGLKSGILITMTDEEEIALSDDRIITVIPAWKWFLSC